MNPHIIGIAGPSSSGKTELARRLVESLPGAAMVTLDSYYRDLRGVPAEARAQINFDHPDALEWELLRDHLRALSEGRAFEEPVYSFTHHTRTRETRRIEPAEYAIVEGLFVLHWPELRAILNTRIYVETDPDICFARRLARDVVERGRTPESVRLQYESTVRPGAEAFIYPSRQYASLVVSGEALLERSAAEVLAELRRATAVKSGG